MARTNQDDFFDELKEWSERKLLLLENYTAAASKIMGIAGQVYYIDGFAGEGFYEDGSKGSPVRVAELALNYQSEAKSYALKCINIEENEKRFANLQAATSEYGTLVLNLQGTFVENVDRILRKVSNQAVICFLDPFGIKGIDWVAVEKIIQRGHGTRTDIWIRFDTQILSRLYGFFDSRTSGADKKFGILPRVFGIHDKNHLYNLLKGETSEERLQKALKVYEGNLIESFRRVRGSGFAASYPIKSLSGQCKYYLVFATSHPKGAILASEVVCGIEETYQRELQEYRDRQSLQLALFPLEPTEEEIFNEKVKALQSDILNTCRGKTLQQIDVYMSIWEKWFGKIKSPHMTAALNSLKNNGDILEANGPLSKDKTRITFRN